MNMRMSERLRWMSRGVDVNLFIISQAADMLDALEAEVTRLRRSPGNSEDGVPLEIAYTNGKFKPMESER
jgi:hypothetical protein